MLGFSAKASERFSTIIAVPCFFARYTMHLLFECRSWCDNLFHFSKSVQPIPCCLRGCSPRSPHTSWQLLRHPAKRSSLAIHGCLQRRALFFSSSTSA